MSSTSQMTDFSDIFTALQNAVRVQTGVAATANQAKAMVNDALQDMHIGFREGMPWAERVGELVTQPEYTTGTLSVDQGSTTLTGSSTLWTTSNAFGVANMRAGGKIVIDGGVEVYEIASVSGDTAAVLTATYIKSDASAVSYSYFEDEYALDSDFLRPVSFNSFDINDEVSLIGRNDFRNRYPRNKTTGKPMVATIVDRAFSGDTTPVRKVKFWKPPDEAYLFRYPFITNKLAVSSSGTAQVSLSADADEPIVPLGYRHAIFYHALARWYRDKRDDDRSQEAKAEYTDIMMRISGDQEIGRSRPRFQPITGPYVSNAKRPYKGRHAGRYVVGSRFDELR